jgi:hypothetical protein
LINIEFSQLKGLKGLNLLNPIGAADGKDFSEGEGAAPDAKAQRRSLYGFNRNRL